MFTVANVLAALRDWAPFELAWERDNIGLLVGSKNAKVRRTLVSLDLTLEVAHEATSLECDLIVTHHPVIFHPLRTIDLTTEQGRVLQHCLANSISVIAMHTNADATSGGLNYGLASLLGLTEVRSLSPVRNNSEMVTVITDPGHGSADSFFTELKQLPDTRWTAAQFENGLARIEIQTPRWKSAHIHAMADSAFGTGLLDAHSAGMNGQLDGYGIGAVGSLPEPMSAEAFIAFVKKQLGCAGVRTTPHTPDKTIVRVAVCGGSGSSYIGRAIDAHADAMVTSDLSYHTFQDHKNDILLIDAGHYETEAVFIPVCTSVLERAFPGADETNIEFLSTRIDTNPVRFA